MCKVCTAVHSLALSTRTFFGHASSMYPGTPFRISLNRNFITRLGTGGLPYSTFNTKVITGLRMCKVCTAAVSSGALWTRTLSQVWACVQYSWVYPLSAQFCQAKMETPHALRKVESLALPLVCHLVGITNGSHLIHKAFIEPSGKTISCDCVWLTCIFIFDVTSTSSCCSHPCTCHSLQVLWLLWRKVPHAGCGKLFPWYGLSRLALKDCIRDSPLRSWRICWWVIFPWNCNLLDTSFLPKFS